MTFVRNVPPDTAAFSDVQRIVVFHGRKVGVVGNFQPRKYLNRTFSPQANDLVIIGVIPKQTFLAVIPARLRRSRLFRCCPKPTDCVPSRCFAAYTAPCTSRCCRNKRTRPSLDRLPVLGKLGSLFLRFSSSVEVRWRKPDGFIDVLGCLRVIVPGRPAFVEHLGEGVTVRDKIRNARRAFDRMIQ
jgi:hypothetical protein